MFDCKWLWKVLQPPSHQILKWSLIFHQSPFFGQLCYHIADEAAWIKRTKVTCKSHGTDTKPLHVTLLCFRNWWLQTKYKITEIPGFLSADFDVLCRYGIGIQNPFDFILGHQSKQQTVLPLDECLLILIFDICTAMMAAALALFFRFSQSTKNQHWMALYFFAFEYLCKTVPAISQTCFAFYLVSVICTSVFCRRKDYHWLFLVSIKGFIISPGRLQT